ncbi:MAG TPA: aminotransferase class V-fold PLP-dependent enzyme [Acidimicrobiia bacterium]|nr:aminotransferase class V-fold PLP-dependent enzyme [Acidimicrobiia bacterium]
MDDLLRSTAERAIAYLEQLDEAPVRPDNVDLSPLGGPFPEGPTDPNETIALMDRLVPAATMAMGSPRFYGWVIGGVYPVALAADWLTSAWDQNTAAAEATPGSVALEHSALRWIIEAGGLPETTWGAFVTGTTVAHVTTLATARSQVLSEVGWDARARGLFGAPEVTVVVGDEVHPSLLKALGIVGLGRERVVRVPVDNQGRMRADALPLVEPPAIVCVQAGNVNSGAFDPMSEIIPAAKKMGAWVHVDGAFGFWAAVSPKLSHLTEGQELADSWATDAHKYLNVPYDAGVALVKHPEALAREMNISAAYLIGEGRDPFFFTPEMSRRARGIPTWAVLKTLGRTGLTDLVERTVRMAQLFARRLTEEGFEILNEVVLNQVLVSFGEPEETNRIVKAIQEEGTLFAGPTVWQGRTAMRISVSSFKTNEEEVERSVRAIVRMARA